MRKSLMENFIFCDVIITEKACIITKIKLKRLLDVCLGYLFYQDFSKVNVASVKDIPLPLFAFDTFFKNHSYSPS